jgi:effector-binding domain-containing protein
MGAYHKIATVISEVETWAKANGEPCSLSFGEYYDNPETVDEDRLRSRGGCVTSNDNVKTIASNGLLPPGYSTSTIDHRDALVASFDGSPAIGPWKVYSKVMADMKTLDLELDGPVLEIYEILSPTSGRTRYIFPVRSLRTK